MKPEIEKETNADSLLMKGYKPLTKIELTELISDTTVSGDYEYHGHRRYKTFMNKNGTMVGSNDWGSLEKGQWSIYRNGYLCVMWDGYWENWIAKAFKIGEEIKFYDIESGEWRTTFNKIVKGEQSLNCKIKETN
jgi:hypothetical protein